MSYNMDEMGIESVINEAMEQPANKRKTERMLKAASR